MIYIGGLPPIDSSKYKMIQTIQDITNYQYLIDFDTVRPCHIDVDINTGQFYQDQEEGVAWKYLNGVVIAYDSENILGKVANSLPEFFARCEMENNIWFSMRHMDASDGGWTEIDDKEDVWQVAKKVLNQHQIKYLYSYYMRC
jgi:hypothetical protein